VSNLTVSLIQTELAWESPEENRAQLGEQIAALPASDLIVLPEMFTTGFSMNALANAEQEAGPTEDWMRDIARQRDCAVSGSIAVRVGDRVYNRMLFVSADDTAVYDKRHLFRMANEHQRYAAGDRQVIVPWRGWRVNLQVCYDLRFPVWMRNRGDYDLLLCVANWPAKRAHHWRSLLIARAIENQAAAVGVNRVGSDVNGLDYSGDSLAITADGTILADPGDARTAETVEFDWAAQQTYREKFPCHMDADSFRLDI